LDGLILFSHGSLLCGSGLALEEHAAQLRASGRWSAVEIGYLNYSEPTFPQAVSDLYGRGIRRITVLPYFLVPGKFVSSDLPREAGLVQARYPELEISVAEPLGYDDSIAEAILELAAKARGPEAWRLDLARAAGECEESPRCPLFGTIRCPGTLSRALEPVG
jgi:sirohydrochlorin cobaltochelatase